VNFLTAQQRIAHLFGAPVKCLFWSLKIACPFFGFDKNVELKVGKLKIKV
jgi:hypothetical protein